MINWYKLIRALKKFGNPPVEWIPKDYWPLSLGGGGRTVHDDWGIMTNNKVLKWFQPWQKIKRINTAFAVPLPLRKIAGNGEPEWMPIRNPDYPIVKGTPIQMMKHNFGAGEKMYRSVLTMTSVHEAGKWSRQEAYINGEWIECYYTRSLNIFGNRITFYSGLKVDQDGPMCWFPEVSGSIKWNRLK